MATSSFQSLFCLVSKTNIPRCVISVINVHTTTHQTFSMLRNDDPNPLRSQLQKRFPPAISKSPHSIKRPISQPLSWFPHTIPFFFHVDLVKLILRSSTAVYGEMVGELEGGVFSCGGFAFVTHAGQVVGPGVCAVVVGGSAGALFRFFQSPRPPWLLS
jgi:hypothetical protein